MRPDVKRKTEQDKERMARKDWLVLASCLASFLVILVVDALTPVGLGIGALFIIPVGLTALSENERMTYVIGLMSSALLPIGYLISPTGVAYHGIVNRSIALFIIWVMVFLVVQRKRTERGIARSNEALREANERLEQRVEERTRKLGESEIRFRNLFQESTAVMLLIDPSTGEIVEANQAAVGYYGYDHDELTSMRITDINTLPSDEVQRELNRSVEGEKRNFHFRHRQSSGEVRDVEVFSGPIYIDERPLLYSIVHDITERKRAEESLRESEERLRELADAAFEGIVISTNGVVVEINRAMLAMTGYQRDEVMGTNILDYFTPESRDVVREKITEPVSKPYEAKIIRRNGTVFPVQIRGKMIEWEGMKARLGAVQDITDLKKAQEELAERAQDLARSNAELQQFAYMASHDLREPLRMVSSYLDILERRYEGKVLDEKAKEYMHFAVDGASRMSAMINDLLAYSRVESKGRAFAPVDMDDVMTIVLTDLKVAMHESGASVTNDALPTVMADKSQMVLLLENLISNAIKFRGEEAPQVHVSARGGDKEWVFSVSDNGIGIEPKDHDRLFKMFQRLHTRENYEGTGMGLAISRRIVEHHGGRIWLESKPGVGSTFYFSVPIR